MLPVMDYENVFNFLLKGWYPVGLSKDQKRSFRRKACGNYKIESGALYYAKRCLKDMSGDRQWKRVIKSKEEQERIMIACHASPEGKSSGQDFKVGVSNLERQSKERDPLCCRPNTSGEGESIPNTSREGNDIPNTTGEEAGGGGGLDLDIQCPNFDYLTHVPAINSG